MKKFESVLYYGLIFILGMGAFFFVENYLPETTVADELTEVEKAIAEYAVVEKLCGKGNVKIKCEKSLCRASYGFQCANYSKIEKYKKIEADELREWNRKIVDCKAAYPIPRNSRVFEDCLYRE